MNLPKFAGPLGQETKTQPLNTNCNELYRWATGCGPCQRMTPIVEELAEQYKDSAVIGKYNIEEENDLTTEFRIMSIPTILFFKNGEQVRDLRLAGAQPKEKLEEQIKKLIAL